MYPHNWVRTSAAQLFGLLFAAWNPEDMIKKNETVSEYLQIDTIKKVLKQQFPLITILIVIVSKVSL